MRTAEAMSVDAAARKAGWPLGLGLGVVFGLTAFFLYQSLQINGGRFVYAQDDPYIHLAIARTLATHGVWGISPESFAAASSSPMWTAALALLWPLGGGLGFWPLLLNLAGAAWLVFALDAQLRRWIQDDRHRAGALVATALVLPLPTLVLIGMEHTLHVAAVVAFCGAAAQRLQAGSAGVVWVPGLLLTLLVTGLRYEGLFVSAIVMALFAWRGRWATALLLACAAAAPPLAYAVYATSQGGLPLPNSVILKSGASRFASPGALLGVFSDWLALLFVYRRPVLAVMILAVLAAVAFRSAIRAPAPSDQLPAPALRPWDTSLVMAAMFLGTAVLHVCLVKLEWFFRYEAYVLALGCLALAANLGCAPLPLLLRPRTREWRDRVQRAAVVACVVVLALPFARRAAEAVVVTARASHEVFLQQYQMGRFFREHYAGASVAVNDIGAVSWLAPVRVVDIAGLASSDVATARRHSSVDRVYLAELVRREDVHAVAAYEWYLLSHGELPSTWRRVGAWDTIPNVAVSGDRVVFYAPDEVRARKLEVALRAFEPDLPNGVRLVVFESRR